jgi:hypothetical protein
VVFEFGEASAEAGRSHRHGGQMDQRWTGRRKVETLEPDSRLDIGIELVVKW